jgi:hypothetical protein
LAGQNLMLTVFAGGRLPAPGSFEPSLETLYPGYGKALVRKRLMDWPNEPHVRTGYASPKKDQIFTVGQALNRPFQQRMVFAGEHTSMAHFGYGRCPAVRSIRGRAVPAGMQRIVAVRRWHTAELGEDVLGHDDRPRHRHLTPALGLRDRPFVEDPKSVVGFHRKSLSRGTAS